MHFGDTGVGIFGDVIVAGKAFEMKIVSSGASESGRGWGDKRKKKY